MIKICAILILMVFLIINIYYMFIDNHDCELCEVKNITDIKEKENYYEVTFTHKCKVCDRKLHTSTTQLKIIDILKLGN